MREDLGNPHRRALLVASLEEIDSDEVALVKYLEERFKFLADHIVDVADKMATTNINKDRPPHKQVRTVFPGRRRMLHGEDDNVRYIPGVGPVRIEPVEFDD